MTLTDPAVSLARLTSMRVGGWARECHCPRSLDDLRDVLGALRARGAQPFILGGGANTVFPDGEYARPVICTRLIDGLEVHGRHVRAECGVLLTRLLQVSIRACLSGLEGAVGIPGTVGGAVTMNAGGEGWSLGAIVEEVGLFPLAGGVPVVKKGADIAWAYRSSGLRDAVVGWVVLRLSPDDRDAILRRVRATLERKKATQPLGSRSAGCVFRNPPGIAAGKLIDQLGLKGLSRGGARVSERHANFIINADGRARAADVRDLLEDLRSQVSDAYGIHLETEIVLAQ